MKKLTAFLISLLATGALAQSIHINDAATLREIQEIWINDASTLRQIQEVWINDGGVLRQVYQNAVVTLSGELGIFGVDTDIVGVRFNTDGTVDKRISTYTQIDNATDWIIPNTAASGSYEVMTDNWVDTGGAGNGFFQVAAAQGVWIALTSSREWNVQADAPDGASSSKMTFDAHIRFSGGATLSSGTYSIESNGS